MRSAERGLQNVLTFCTRGAGTELLNGADGVTAWGVKSRVPARKAAGAGCFGRLRLEIEKAGLALDEPHGPAGHQDSADEPGKAVEGVANHGAGGVALGDSEDDRGAESEDQRGGEVRKVECHNFFPIMVSSRWRCGARRWRR